MHKLLAKKSAWAHLAVSNDAQTQIDLLLQDRRLALQLSDVGRALLELLHDARVGAYDGVRLLSLPLRKLLHSIDMRTMDEL